MPRTISPGPAGLKFWRGPGLSADNANDTGSLPAAIGDQFNPWGSKRPVQDWVWGSPPWLITVLVPPDTDNLPAGAVNWFNPWGPKRPVQDWFRGPIPTVPVIFTAGSGSYTLTGGSAVTFAFGQVAAAGAYTLTGSAATQAFGHAAASGSYALTGAAAALALRHVAGSGSYALSGNAAALALRQVAGAGSYTLTGAAAAFVIPGVVTYLPAGMSGGYVPWRRSHPVNLRTSTGRPLAEAAEPPVTLTAAGGSYAITGSAASLTVAAPPDTTNLPAGATNWFNPWGRRFPVDLRTSTRYRPLAEVAAPAVLTAAAGSYAITGSSAALALRLSANSGTYTVSGTAAVLARRYVAGAGAYAITGTTAQLVQAGTITLACGAGSYTLTGAAAALTASAGLLMPTPVERRFKIATENRTAMIAADTTRTGSSKPDTVAGKVPKDQRTAFVN